MDYQYLVEGAWVTYRDGYYYLFFSGDNCCGEEPTRIPHYAVMVARSKSATGPFEQYGRVMEKNTSAILVKNDAWDGPGHNSVIRDAAGQDWMVYHAVDPKQRINDNFIRRVMLIDLIVYKDGWPSITDSSSFQQCAARAGD